MSGAVDTLAPHAMTLATARGRSLCKTRHADGRVWDYDAARTLDLVTIEAPTLEALSAALARLAARHDTCVLRGAILDPARARGVRRLLYHDRDTGDEPTLGEAPRAWLALDFDGLPMPDGVDPHDLAECGEVARLALPGAFHGAACFVTATASHGFKPTARLRLWFLLSRALTGTECKRWLHTAPVDRSIFGAVQPIYTAAPRFIGMADPLPTRLISLDGAERVTAPSVASLAPPVRRPAAQAEMTATTPGAGRYASRALARAYAAVAGAAVNNRHPTALSQAWGLARLVQRGMLSADDIASAIDRALQDAGKPEGEGRAIVEWAVAQRAGGAA